MNEFPDTIVASSARRQVDDEQQEKEPMSIVDAVIISCVVGSSIAFMVLVFVFAYHWMPS